jgi:hypothetical protein
MAKKLVWVSTTEHGILTRRATGSKHHYTIKKLDGVYVLYTRAVKGYGPTNYERRATSAPTLTQILKRVNFLERDV